VLASARFSYALIASLALLWVYTLTALAQKIPVLPRREGISLVLSSFISGLFILILSIFCPILAMDSLLFLILCPLCCVSSGGSGKLTIEEALYRACAEGLVFSVLILILALIREPLGYGTISLPGGRQGILCPVRFPAESYLPLRVFASSAGAFFLLGYGAALFRYFGGNSFSPDRDNSGKEAR
jgi:hypothetical protein